MSEQSPDIPRPKLRVGSFLRRHWWWIALAVAAGGIVTAAVVAKRLKAPTVGPALHIPQGIDSAFYQAPERVPMGEPKGEPEDLPPPRPKAPPPPPKPLTAAVAFKVEPAPAPPPPPPPPDPAEVFNKARRGTAVAKVSVGSSLELPQEASVDTDWGEAKSEASYPLDMSRVIPVTRRLPALLREAIDSSLEGKVTAVIEENIYGGGGRDKFVLIPAGSEAVGRYKKSTKQGEDRISFLFTRIITPDGINIRMGDAELADAMGRSGLTGDVDTRFWDRYGMALLTASLGAISGYAMPVRDMGQAVVVQQYGGATMGLANQILQQNVVLAPKILVPAGARILISPSKDIWFKPPKGSTVDAVALDDGGKRK